jgi:signal transduction histidine kinase
MSAAGLGRFPAAASLIDLAGRAPSRVYTRAEGLPGDRIYRVFEDSRGDLWIGGDMPAGVAGLARWERATDRIQALPDVRAGPGDMPNALAEDGSGAIWVGFIRGGLGRLRGGRFTLFSPEQGAPRGTVTAIHRDPRGRLWIGTNQDGLARVDDPFADLPRFVRIGTAQGLATSNVRCITSDLAGRIYAGTVRGVDRLDPDTGVVRHYTTTDGLPAGFVLSALRDDRGDLWFGTRSGLARLRPDASSERSAPPVAWIGGLRVGGVAARVSHLGARTLAGIPVEPDRNQVQIEFFVVNQNGDRVRFQHALSADDDWSAPTDDRSVQFSRLAPGRHLFRVRALAADGSAGEAASLELNVLPTLWQRGPVRGALAALIALALYGAHRFRVGHLVALERVRSRLASDLHDDIGANLSQIAILSEVTRRRPDAVGAAVGASLEQIASLARASVDSMGDIVWATNPGRDSLHDLSQRMRQHATELLSAHGIAFTFQGPAEDVEPQVHADVRREVFLVFKEALNNLARHSGCTSAHIELTRQNGLLLLRVSDDGKGISGPRRQDGHGLASMDRRARALGAVLDIAAGANGGTVVTLRAPLTPSRRADGYARA